MTKENAKKLYKFYVESEQVERAAEFAKARPHVLEEVPEEKSIKKGKN